MRISGYANLLQEEKYTWQQWGKSAKWFLSVKYYLNSAPVELTLTNWHSTKLSKMAMHWRNEKLSKAWQNKLETNSKDGPHQSRLIPAPNTKLLNLKQGWQHFKRLQTKPKPLLLAILKQKLQHQHLKAHLLHLEYNLLLQQLSKDKDLLLLTLPNCWSAQEATTHGQWLESNMIESLSDTKYKTWFKNLKLDNATRQTVERNIVAVDNWWENQPEEAEATIHRVAVCSGIPPAKIKSGQNENLLKVLTVALTMTA